MHSNQIVRLYANPASVVPFALLVITLFVLVGCGGNNSAPVSVASPDAAPETASGTATPEKLQPLEVAADEQVPVEPVPAVTHAEELPPQSSSGTKSPEATKQPKPEPVPVDSNNSSTPAVKSTEFDAADRLEGQLASFEIPPAWLATVQPKWDTSKPWKEARKEIRRLLGEGDDASRREGIRLTWDYLQKDDIGDGHEYGMYLFLGGEPLWAVHVYREWLARTDHSYPPYFGVKALASLYTDYGLFDEAEVVLQKGMKFRSPDPKWNEVRAAELHDAFGDLYAAWGKTDLAKSNYQEAVRLFPLGKPPYGKHLLPRKAKKVQSKLDLLSKASLDDASLRDGTYRETTLGYSGDIQLAVDIKGSRIAGVRVVKHQEKIDQNACVVIPQRIASQQSLQVDGISGATVTKDAIVDGTLRALQKAGLK